MPLKLRDPRPGKSPFFTIRGTHRGVYVERSTGTADRREAQRILRECEHDIDGGRLRRTVGPTFASAMIGYLDAGGEARFLSPLLEHFGETALADIPALALTEEEARRLRLGQPLAVLPVARRTSLQDVPKDSVLCAMTAGKLVAMVRIEGGEIRPVRVLNF